MILKELLALMESDKIDGLPTGNALFNQRFHYFGFYDRAKPIIADKLAGRWALIVQSLRQGDQGITDRDYSTYVDLGPNGHGFSDKALAQARAKAKKKEASKNVKDGHGVFLITTPVKVEDIESALKKLKPMAGDSSILPLSSIGLAYA